MQAVVLAAGLGTRLLPVTKDRSKAMVPVLGRPLVELAIEPLVLPGLDEVILVVGPDDQEIRDYFSTTTTLRIRARFMVQEERLGMAHALAVVGPYLTGDFVLTACDSLIPQAHVNDLLNLHTDGSAVLSLMDVAPELVGRSAAVEIQGDEVRRIVEKPRPGEAPSDTVSLPHYILPRGVIDLLDELEPSPRGEIELQSAIQRLIDDDCRVVGVRTTSRLQVSKPEDLLRLNLEMLQVEDGGERVFGETVNGGPVLKGPLRIEDGVTLGRYCEIGPNVYLESGCVIGNSVVVRDSVVLRGVSVPDHQRIEGKILS